MTHSPFTALAAVLGLGISAQWIAWKLKLPSILLLLLFGLLAGQFGYINPDRLLGDLLVPVASFSVAVILFEGAMSLKVQELQETGITIGRVILVGILVTWILASLLGILLLGLPVPIALLIAAILTVTGPTVILPMLRYIRPSGQTAHILKWEGIVNDPIGAMLALIVFEAVLASGFEATSMAVLGGVVKTLSVGGFVGFVTAWLFIFMLSRHWIPHYLQSPVALMLVFISFAFSNQVQDDSGLFTVTLMGLILANQRQTNVTHIIEFKENLGLILLSVLFILLAARLRFEDFFALGWQGLAFLVLLIVLVRPLAIFLATRKSNLSNQEKIFLSAMAPRGIVAAAISSVFALRLEAAGYVEAYAVVEVVFLTILGTVIIYGLLSMPLAKRLQLAGRAQGIMFLGASNVARSIAEPLKKAGFPVVLVDSNLRNISSARMDGLNTIYGNIFSDEILDAVDLMNFGQFIALTPNDEVNALAALRFHRIFDKEKVYQLPPVEKDGVKGAREALSQSLGGNVLFGNDVTYPRLDAMLRQGASVKLTELTREFDYDDLRKVYGGQLVPLFLITEQEALQVIAPVNKLAAKPDQKLVYLAPAVS